MLVPARSRFGSIPATGRSSNSRVDDVPKSQFTSYSGETGNKGIVPDKRATRSRLSQLRKLLKNVGVGDHGMSGSRTRFSSATAARTLAGWNAYKFTSNRWNERV